MRVHVPESMEEMVERSRLVTLVLFARMRDPDRKPGPTDWDEFKGLKSQDIREIALKAGLDPDDK